MAASILAPRVADLAALLAAEETLYRGLRDLLLEEREKMLELDADAIGSVALRKEMIADEGRLLEEARVALVEEIAQSLGLTLREPSLTELCAALGTDAAPLRPLHGRLASLIVGVRELADANRVLGSDRLDYVRGTLSILGAGSAEPVSDSYHPGAQATPRPDAGRLLHRSA